MCASSTRSRKALSQVSISTMRQRPANALAKAGTLAITRPLPTGAAGAPGCKPQPQSERQAHARAAAEPGSAQACNLLTPAKGFLDPLADLLAQSIARMPGHAAINGGAPPRRVLRHVRGHVHGLKLVDEVLCIKGLVGPQRAPVRAIGP